MSTRYVSTVDVRLHCRPRHVSVYVIKLSDGRPVSMPEGPPSPHYVRFALVSRDHTEDSPHDGHRRQAGRVASLSEKSQSVTIVSYGGLDTLRESEHGTGRQLHGEDCLDRCVESRTLSRTNYHSPHASSISSLLRAAYLEQLTPSHESSSRDDLFRVDPSSDSGLATDVSLTESMMSEYWSGAEGLTPAVTPRSWSSSLWGGGDEDSPEMTLWGVDSGGQSSLYRRRQWPAPGPQSRRRVSTMSKV